MSGRGRADRDADASAKASANADASAKANVSADAEGDAGAAEVRAGSVRSLRLGHGANCSSVGSVVDTLFLGATLGGAILAAVCAAMKVEGVTVVGGRANEPAASARGEREPERGDGEEEEEPS